MAPARQLTERERGLEDRTKEQEFLQREALEQAKAEEARQQTGQAGCENMFYLSFFCGQVGQEGKGGSNQGTLSIGSGSNSMLNHGIVTFGQHALRICVH